MLKFIYLILELDTKLTLKMPRKPTSQRPASENVVCLCLLLNILANFSTIFAYRQTVWPLIRLLLEEQSDLGPLCLQKDFKNHKQMTKQMTIVVIGSLRVKVNVILLLLLPAKLKVTEMLHKSRCSGQGVVNRHTNPCPFLWDKDLNKSDNTIEQN